jgi:DNA-binding Lrp family transcriptional regulator
VTRFEDYATRLGIPRATLASRLDHLCAAGVLDRLHYQRRPPRSEYVLTAKGRALEPVLLMLMRWGDEWVRDDDPPTRLVDESTGASVELMLVDRSTGVPFDELKVRSVGRITDGIRSPPSQSD